MVNVATKHSKPPRRLLAELAMQDNRIIVAVQQHAEYLRERRTALRGIYRAIRQSRGIQPIHRRTERRAGHPLRLALGPKIQIRLDPDLLHKKINRLFGCARTVSEVKPLLLSVKRRRTVDHTLLHISPIHRTPPADVTHVRYVRQEYQSGNAPDRFRLAAPHLRSRAISIPNS